MIYDEFARRLTNDYELFLMALSGKYLSLIAPGVEVSPMLVRQLEQTGQTLRQTFLTTVEPVIQRFIEVNPSDAAPELEMDLLAYFDSATQQNIDTLVSRLKGSARSELAIFGNELHGGMGLLLQRTMTQPDFSVITPSGRTFKALQLTRAVSRNFAYHAWIYAELERLAAESDLAEIVYPDPTHPGHGTVFSISGMTPGYPSFQSIQDEFFHFNATAQVASHVSP